MVAALVVLSFGQRSIAWFALAALAAILVLWRVGLWYKHHGPGALKRAAAQAHVHIALPRGSVAQAMGVLILLIFSKNCCLASLSSYFTFYLMRHFGVSVREAQLHLFAFLAAVAAGSFIGGPVGDRIGRKPVIWFSILGVLPFTLILPYADLMWIGILSMVIGLILSSAFSAIIVYGQELAPGKVGTIAGLFFRFAFGMGGLGV